MFFTLQVAPAKAAAVPPSTEAPLGTAAPTQQVTTYCCSVYLPKHTLVLHVSGLKVDGSKSVKLQIIVLLLLMTIS